jgi:hypothetical protein
MVPSLQTSIATEPSAPDVGVQTPSLIVRVARRVQTREALLVTAFALLPFLVIAVKLVVDKGYANWGDDALLEMQTRDIGRHLVQLGPYSRFGFAHPGPMMFYVFALPYWLFGGASVGINFAPLVVNAVALVGVAWVAWRRGGMLLLASTLLLVELFLRQWGVSPDFVRQPWNPYVTVLPLLLFLFLAWEVARSERWALPAVVIVGSFLTQSHLGYVPAVGVVGLLAVCLGWRGYRAQWKTSDRTRLRTAIFLSFGAAILLWLPPLTEQLTHWPGNVGHMAAFQVRTKPDHTLADGVAVTLRTVANLPAWLLGKQLGPDGTFPGTAWLAIPLFAVFGAAGVIAWRRRAHDAMKFGLIAIVGVAVAMLAMARVTGPLYVYLIRWVQMPAIAVLVFPFVVASDPAVRTARRRIYVGAIVAVLFVLVGVTLSNTNQARALPEPGGRGKTEVASLTAAIRAAVPSGTRTIVIEPGSVATYPDEWGVAVELERAGFTVWFPNAYANEVGQRRASSRPHSGMHLAFGPESAREQLAARPGARELGGANGIVVFQVD